MSEFEKRMKELLEEPESTYGEYLKPDQVKIGDMILIEEVVIEPQKEVNTTGGPVTIPARPVITGSFYAKGQSQSGQQVKFSLSKSNEKKLYQLFGMPLNKCIGKRVMVSGVQRKNIRGRDTTWIEWTGIP